MQQLEGKVRDDQFIDHEEQGTLDKYRRDSEP